MQDRTAIIEFLTRKWRKELDYRLVKEGIPSSEHFPRDFELGAGCPLGF
jgi:hypothetical protein